MRKINLATVLLSLAVFSGASFADIPLESNDQIQGNWKLEYTKKTVSSTDTIKREDSWNFKDGKVSITHIPREGTFYDQIPVNYEIEGGKLKISLLGRSDKFDVFSLLEKSEKSMTLKGKFGDVYHFIKN